MAAVRELQEEANVYITVDDLHPFAHWVTPEIETRRFDTRFFLARMPDGQQAMHDDGETTALEWLSPREAIARFERRELARYRCLGRSLVPRCGSQVAHLVLQVLGVLLAGGGEPLRQVLGGPEVVARPCSRAAPGGRR